MADISKLKERILREAGESAAVTVEEARTEANRILETAHAQAEAESARLMDIAAAEAAVMEKRMLSVAGLDARKMKLQARQDAIDGVFGKALEMLESLPDTEYFGILSKMILTEIKSGNEELILSPGDFKRMPADFADGFNAKTGGKIRILKGDDQMGAGFTIRDGDVEMNGTFETLFRMRRESIETEVYDMLFGNRGDKGN